MSVQVQFRRGNTAQHSTFTGAPGEITVDTDKDTVVVHDGTTAGGHPLAPNVAYDIANSAFDRANTAASAGITIGDSANNYAGQMANSVNSHVNTVGVSGNAYANVVGTSGNAYTDLSTSSSNNYAGVMANASNAWANTMLSNTDGVLFNGSLNVKNTLYATDLTVRNNVFIGGSVTNVTQLMFNTSTNITPTTPGTLSWSQDDSTLHFDMDTPGNVIAHIGQDLFFLVKNQSGSTITKGTVVRYSGTLGASGRLLISPAIGNNAYPSKYVLGVAADNIANGADGFVLTRGKLKRIDTSMFSAGDVVYLSSSTLGGLANTMPTAPNNKVTIGYVVNSDNTNGSIQVNPVLGSKINEDELAELNELTNGDVLAYVSANGRFENKNTLVSAFNTTNAAFGLANGNFTNAAAAFSHSNTTYAAVNSAFGVINAAYTQSNTDNIRLSSAYVSQNAGYVVANAAFDKANAANVLAYNTSISANNYAGAMANASNAYAETIGTNANNYSNATFLKLTGGTLSGDLSVTGNLSITGNTAFVNVTNYKVEDSLIYLADTNYTSDIVEIGFVGNYNNGACSTVHTGLFRSPGNKEYYLFQGYDKEPANNYIDPTGNNITNAVLNADLITGNLWLGGANAIVWISATYVVANAAFDKANAANVLAYNTGISANNYAGSMANSSNGYAETIVASNLTTARAYTNTSSGAANNYAGAMANSANAYAGTVGTNANTYAGVMANSSNNYAGAMANSSNNYAGVMANGAGTIANAAFGHSNTTYTAVNSAFGVINAAFNYANTSAQLAYKTIVANGTSIVAGSNADTLTISSSNNILLIANATNDGIQITQVPSGVTATTYGGATQVPSFVVDTYGRITSAANVAVQGMDYAYVNTVWNVANAKVDTITSNSTARIWANSVTVGSIETVYLDLATSGVTATTYGGSTQIPVIVVDAYGRLTSASNVAVSGMDYPYVNTSTAAANAYTNTSTTAANNYLGGLANTGYAGQTMTVTTLSDASGTIAWDASTSRMATVTLSGTGRTLSNPTNLKAGSYVLIIKQDATGSRTITTWGNAFKWPAAVAPTLSTTASTTDVFSFWCDGTNLYGTYIPDCR